MGGTKQVIAYGYQQSGRGDRSFAAHIQFYCLICPVEHVFGSVLLICPKKALNFGITSPRQREDFHI